MSGDTGFAAYTMTKEAIRGLSRIAAKEWGPDGIRVNVICPAAMSPSAQEFAERSPERFRRVASVTRWPTLAERWPRWSATTSPI